MLKRPLILIWLSLSLSGCASIDHLKTNFDKPTASSTILERSDYISAAIADWISEEANTSHFQRIGLAKATTPDDILALAINQKLLANGLQIAKDNDKPDLNANYLVGEIDDKILIRVRANNREASRLFSKGDNYSIIPASPLSIRASQ